MSDHDEDIPATDEQALTELFAALVADAPASSASPLELIKLGRIEQRRALDARIKRFKVVRNVLVAAALAALVVLIVPHLGSGSAESTAASSSSSSAAATFAAAGGSAPQQGGEVAAGSAASNAPVESGAASAGSSAAAAASGAASSAGPAGPAISSPSAMSSGAAAPNASGATRGEVSRSSSTSASAAATSAPASSAAGCPALPAEALASFEAAFPAGYFGPVLSPFAQSSGPNTRCSLFESRLPVVKQGVTVFVAVRRAPVAVCGIACRPRPGQAGTYVGDSGGPLAYLSPLYVYADGYEVAVFTTRTGPSPVGPTFEQLAAGARAVIKTLG